MRATTPRKKAMRTLWHAGLYVRKKLYVSPDQTGGMGGMYIIMALEILANAYNQVLLGEPDGKPLQRTA